MKLSTNFSLSEFVRSDTADRMGIDNDLPIELMTNARATADMLERIRAYLVSDSGKSIPIIITSGYRCPQLNRAIGSGDTSDHRKAMAADFRAPAYGTPLQVCKALAPVVSVLGIGQLILEFATPNGGGWVHVSTRIPDKIINRIVTASKQGFAPGIVEA
jgi:hypothetical protein